MANANTCSNCQGSQKVFSAIVLFKNLCDIGWNSCIIHQKRQSVRDAFWFSGRYKCCKSAAVIGGAMQAMAMVSGQYMNEISGQFNKKIRNSINSLATIR